MLLPGLLLACLEPRPAADPGCTGCHTSPPAGAPFVGLGGVTDPATAGVGAHDRHLFTPRFSRPGTCTDCHAYPASLDAPGHVDTPVPAEVGWASSAFAATELAEPYDGTCMVYCHGITLTGGTLTTPDWLDPYATECGSCHGNPPPPPHPALERPNDLPPWVCQDCHTPATDGQDMDPLQHVDGVLQYACDDCHGADGDPAPDSGAHAVHLAGTPSSAKVACGQCHVVPGADGLAHADGAPAEVTFGSLASQDHAPAWTPPTCADTYCHAQPGGLVPEPDWNATGGLGCTACHGQPPPDPHPQDSACDDCHTETADPTLHVNGIVEESGTPAQVCEDCHGTPPSTGAHDTHAAGTALSSAVACQDCHVVPAAGDLAHVDGVADVAFSGVAIADGASPTWTPTTCAGTHCHAGPGGTNGTPDWTAVGTGEAACGTCHANPPPAPHPNNPSCSGCHPNAGPGLTIVTPAEHVDGQTTL